MDKTKQEQVSKNLPKQYSNILEIKENNNHFELSAYTDQLTPENLVNNITKIKKAFPVLSKEFYDILMERLKDKGFTDQRLKDAVNNVIDNCIYPTPTIAQFLTYDKNIKLYSYAQMVKLNDDYGGEAFKFFRPIDIGKDKPMYASINDIKEYNLKLWDV